MIVCLGVGGAESMLVAVTSALACTEFEPIVVTLRDPGPLAETLGSRGIPVRSLRAHKLRSTIGLPFRLRRILRIERIDLVQTWMYHADLVGGIAGRLAGVPVVWGIQAGARTASLRSSVTRWICARLSRALPSAIICGANSIERIHRELGYSGEIIVIPNSCDLQVFRPDSTARDRIRRELGLEDGTPVIGMVARLDSTKNHDMLIQATSLLDGSVHLVLVGADVDSQSEDLRASIERAGLQRRCHLMGIRDDIAAIDASLDVFVLASHSEGLPLALAEAMACGVPCVATDVGECGAVIGPTGAVVPPGAVEAMAAAIGRILALPPSDRLALGQSARARVAERYSSRAAARSYAEVWSQVLSTRGARETTS